MKYEVNKPVTGLLSRSVLIFLSLIIGGVMGISNGLVAINHQLNDMAFASCGHTPGQGGCATGPSDILADSTLQVEPVNTSNLAQPQDIQPALGVRLVESNVGSRIAPLNEYYSGPQLQVQ